MLEILHILAWIFIGIIAIFFGVTVMLLLIHLIAAYIFEFRKEKK